MVRFSNSNKADNNLGQDKIKKENYLELNFIARILWRFLKISTLLIVARQLLKRRRHYSVFLNFFDQNTYLCFLKTSSGTLIEDTIDCLRCKH